MSAELREAEGAYRRLYETNVGLMRHLAEVRLDLPRPFAMAAEYVLSRDLIRTLLTDPVDLRFVRSLLEQADSAGTGLDREGVDFALAGALGRLLRRAADTVPDPAPLLLAAGMVKLAREFSFEPDLWRAQNACYDLRVGTLPGLGARAGAGDEAAAAWAEAFAAVAEELLVAVD